MSKKEVAQELIVFGRHLSDAAIERRDKALDDNTHPFGSLMAAAAVAASADVMEALKLTLKELANESK